VTTHEPLSAQNAPLSRTLLVLGGAGFIGRHVLAACVEATQNQSWRVIVASRQPENIDTRIPPSARQWQRHQVRMETMLEAADWQEALEGVDVVLNCVGILRQRRGATYNRVHHLAPAALAKACKTKAIRLVHVSALGLHEHAKSRFLTSKLRGEKAIAEIQGDWFIARPSLIDGPDGYGARWLRRVSQLPFFVTPSQANGRIAAIHIADLSDALVNLCVRGNTEGVVGHDRDRVFELGGQQSYTFAEYILALRALYTDRPAWVIKIPSVLARLGAHLCDLIHFSPFSFGHWELLHRDNFPLPNRLPELLSAEPRNVPSHDWTGD